MAVYLLASDTSRLHLGQAGPRALHPFRSGQHAAEARYMNGQIVKGVIPVYKVAQTPP